VLWTSGEFPESATNRSSDAGSFTAHAGSLRSPACFVQDDSLGLALYGSGCQSSILFPSES
jgi:hypothetical protein